MAKRVTAVLTLCVLGALGKIIPEEEINRRDNSPVVETADGFVLGTTDVTEKGTRYNAFRGIPYAKPPIGNLRFASPVKYSPWNGYWNATKDANVCIQGSGDTISGSEDCLYVSVYAPQDASNLAVMVWVYGGAFTSGGSSYENYAPDFLLDDNVVYVSFNYRLGILGFMSTEDQTVSGNWGLKDQVLALQWIHDNIAAFGGDRNRITIFGESAGGASVSYLLQIPQAQGLFNNAIIQSGSSLNLWALTTRARQAAFQVGYNLGIPALLARTLLDRLRDVDAYRLQNTATSVLTQVYIVNPLRGLPWAPIIEVEGPDAVFTKNSDDFLRSGEFPNKVPVMIGFTSNEAGHAHGLSETLRQYLALFDLSSTNLAPYSLSSRSSVRRTVADEVRSSYFGTEALSSQLNEVVDFINVDQFTRGVRRLAEDVAPHVPAVYFYVFGYQGQITGETPYDGAGHAEELFYLFKQPGTYSSTDLVVRDKLVKLWTNFAKSSNPTPTTEALLDNIAWPPVTPGSGTLNYVWLNESLSLDVNPSQKDYDFYSKLFQEHGDGSYLILPILMGTLGEDSPVVEISDGKILGVFGETDKGTKYNAFKGIPYAQPPLGDLRFASPVKNSPWSDYWNATAEANICIQGSGDAVRGSEDCLYVNVYAPQNAENLAVMVWIYGGAFTSGDSTYDSYVPDFFLDENVVLVSFNYRLGVFGFLSTEDQVASGNFGLKDQVLALKWIRENIAHFGGDSNRVTIFGESAGGASVSYLVQIPQAQGLFDAAIIQSGNSLNLWALTTRARSLAFKLGWRLGIPTFRSKTLLKRLRTVNAYTLQQRAQTIQTALLVTNPLRGLVFAPIKEAEGPDAVFTQNSDDYLRSGGFPSKVPMMVGFTSNEAGHAHGLPEWLRQYLLVFDVSISNLVPYSLTSSTIKKLSAAVKTKHHFFGWSSMRRQFNKVVKYINSDQFTRGIRRFVDNVTPYVPSVYFYVFGYMGQIVGENPYDGAGHAEELFYLFKQPGQYSDKDLVVSKKLVKLWTNFAKTFNPTPAQDPLLDNITWPKVDPNSGNLDFIWLNYTLSPDVNPDQESYQFFNKLFDKYGRGSYTTY
ncbi:uncharacterized protein [Euwallacea similis]|uniref:uncharacterized protein n=1 Tax=Euwallacea similis TaxID=1736056 RepID=UPI00344BE630